MRTTTMECPRCLYTWTPHQCQNCGFQKPPKKCPNCQNPLPKGKLQTKFTPKRYRTVTA